MLRKKKKNLSFSVILSKGLVQKSSEVKDSQLFHHPSYTNKANLQLSPFSLKDPLLLGSFRWSWHLPSVAKCLIRQPFWVEGDTGWPTN
jgi:hypothetical protein